MPAMPALRRQDEVFVLDLGDDENRFHPDRLAALHAALDEVEHSGGPRSLVTTGSGRFYSNGLDLDHAEPDSPHWPDYLEQVEQLFARLLSLPVFTVAAIQGHAFAAGAMLSLTHDIRIMREDRGYWCLPETDLGIPFTAGMAALVHESLLPAVAREAMLTARRYGGRDAAGSAIVDRTAPEADLLSTAIVIAQERSAAAGRSLAETKRHLHTTTLSALTARTTITG